MRRPRPLTAAITALALSLAACGGGGGGSTPVMPAPGQNPVPIPVPPGGVFVPPTLEALTAADVQRIIAQAVGEAQARRLPSVITVVDRPGNVLAVFTMAGARATAVVPNSRDGTARDVQGLALPATLASIAKAITAAYLSSGGNAFTSRTASEIVQEHFPPAPTTIGLESGPLFGVQFSQLPCSDLSARYMAAGGPSAMIGPKRSPLGLSADAGSVPLYKNGVIVGAIGVMGDGVYGFDPNILDVDEDAEEYIAVAGSIGFEAPAAIRADRITVDGPALRFVDADVARLVSNPATAPAFSTLAAVGSLTPVRGYFAETGTPAVLAGTAYGSEASGLRRATSAEFSNTDAYVLSNGSGANRYPPRAGADGAEVSQPLSAAETRALLEEAFTIMSRARGQIRRPLDSPAQVTISVVDTLGNILGIVRGPDAPIFGTDVSLQKARTAAFFSNARAGEQLLTDPSADVRGFVAAARTFLSDPAALTGRTAFTDRANGNLSRPYFPDGEVGRPNGPFSRPIGQWSPFSTGLQSAIILGNLAQHIGYVANGGTDVPQRCTALPVTGGITRLANGIQIFPGSVPIYRGSQLVGGIGVSGDGIDQDDMISFLGLFNAGARVGGIGNADKAIRSDQIVVNVGAGVRLRYVGCPFAPFLDTANQSPCDGK